MTLRLIAKPVAADPRRRASAGQGAAMTGELGLEESEPPIRQPLFHVDTRSPERIKLSEELAILNRPLEDEIEYYDEVPPSRAKPVFAVVAVLAALGGAGYLLAQPDRADDNTVAPSTRKGERVSAIGIPSASANAAVVPANAPPTEPVLKRVPVAPAAASAAAGSTSAGEPSELEPEGDPPVTSAAATRNSAVAR